MKPWLSLGLLLAAFGVIVIASWECGQWHGSDRDCKKKCKGQGGYSWTTATPESIGECVCGSHGMTFDFVSNVPCYCECPCPEVAPSGCSGGQAMSWNGYEPLTDEEIAEIGAEVAQARSLDPKVRICDNDPSWGDDTVARLLATIHEMRERRCGTCGLWQEYCLSGSGEPTG